MLVLFPEPEVIKIQQNCKGGSLQSALIYFFCMCSKLCVCLFQVEELNYAKAGSHKLYDLSGRTGSLMYMAPEVLKSERYNEKV